MNEGNSILAFPVAIWQISTRGQKISISISIALFLSGVLLESAQLLLIPLLISEISGNNVSTEISSKASAYLELININISNNRMSEVALLFSAIVLLSTSLKLIGVRLINNTSSNVGASISRKAFHNIISKGCIDDNTKGASESVSTLTSSVVHLVMQLTQLLQSICYVSSALFVLLILISLSTVQFLSSLFIVIPIYFIIAKIASTRTNRLSRKYSELDSQIHRIVSNSLSSIDEILVLNASEQMAHCYYHVSKGLRQISAQISTLSIFPKFLLESIVLLLIPLSVLIQSYFKTGVIGDLAFLAVVALGSQRVIPAFQYIYSYWIYSKSYYSIVKRVLNVASEKVPAVHSVYPELITQVHFEERKPVIVAKNISYRFPGSEDWLFKNFSFTIYSGDIVGITGESGCGKTTLLKMLMGILKPTMGSVEIKRMGSTSEESFGNFHWYNTFTYIPQNPIMIEGSFSENMAFPKPIDSYDVRDLEEMMRDFGLPELMIRPGQDYSNENKNIKDVLSGGQVQRLAIIRGLLRERRVLFLDEPTSALDDENERTVLKKIQNLDYRPTIIMVTHRSQTLEICTRRLHLANIGHPTTTEF